MQGTPSKARPRASVPEEHTGLLLPGQPSGCQKKLFEAQDCSYAPARSNHPARGSNRLLVIAVASGLFVVSMVMLTAVSYRSPAPQSRAFRPAKLKGYSFEVKAEEDEEKEADGDKTSTQDVASAKRGAEEPPAQNQPGNPGFGFGGVNLGFGAINNAVKRLLGKPSEEEEIAAEQRKQDARREAKREERAMIKAHKEEQEQEKQALEWINQKREEQKTALEKLNKEADERAQALEAQKEKERMEKKKAEDEQIKQMKEALAQAKRDKALRQQQEEEERKRCLKEKNKTDAMSVTLYCFSLMMPFGYEPALLATQLSKHVGIFECEGHDVFSNSTTVLSTGKPAPIDLVLMNGSLAVEYGGKWGTALNTGVFNRLWTEVINIGRYRQFDWTVKVDPDAVFFPSRLRMLLKVRTPLNTVKMQGDVPAKLKCNTCKLVGHEAESCAWRVQTHQAKGKTCPEALAAAARPAPDDCGCVCDDLACDLPAVNAMYLNNCKWGLHGPIEVFSRRAVASYIAGLPQCVGLLEHPWGEDKFIDQCMQKLGVTRENEYDLLSETACGEEPAPCGSKDVAFHPFKSIDSYFACYNFAERYGKGPEDLDCNKKAFSEPTPQTQDEAFMKK